MPEILIVTGGPRPPRTPLDPRSPARGTGASSNDLSSKPPSPGREAPRGRRRRRRQGGLELKSFELAPVPRAGGPGSRGVRGGPVGPPRRGRDAHPQGQKILFSAPFHPFGTSMSGIDAKLHPDSDFPGPGTQKRQIGSKMGGRNFWVGVPGGPTGPPRTPLDPGPPAWGDGGNYNGVGVQSPVVPRRSARGAPPKAAPGEIFS